MENSGNKLASFDQLKCEILADLKKLKYNDLEDLFYRMELTNDHFVDILDVKYFAGSTTRFTLALVIYEITDINLILKALPPNELETNFTIDAVRLD